MMRTGCDFGRERRSPWRRLARGTPPRTRLSSSLPILAILTLATLAAEAGSGCAHRSGDDQGRGRASPSAASGKPTIDGDWVVAARIARLRVANGGAIVSEAAERRFQLFGYRLAETHGPLVGLAASLPDDAYTRIQYPPPLFARHARFLLVSPSLGILSQPARAPALAFRPGPAPLPLRGRYTFSQPVDRVTALVVGPRAVELLSPKGREPEALAILGASEISGPGGLLALESGERRSQLRVLSTPAGKLAIEIESEHYVKGPFDVRFTPAPGAALPADAQRDTGTPRLPPSGQYVIEDLSGERSERLALEGSRLTLTTTEGQASGTITWVGRMGGSGAHVHLDLGPADGIRHVDLWPIDDVGQVFVLARKGGARGGRDGAVQLMYPASAVPGVAPSRGLDGDLERLCKELGGLAPATGEAAVVSALQRVGEQAESVVMRSLCAGAMAVDPSMRHTLLRTAIAQNGRALPSCPGLERLRASEPNPAAAPQEVAP